MYIRCYEMYGAEGRNGFPGLEDERFIRIAGSKAGLSLSNSSSDGLSRKR